MIPFSDEDLIDPVKDVLDSIRPMLKKDGGDMEFLGIKNSVVYVRLVGACNGCPSAGQTLKYGVERELKIAIHPEITVVNIPVGEEFKL